MTGLNHFILKLKEREEMTFKLFYCSRKLNNKAHTDNKAKEWLKQHRLTFEQIPIEKMTRQELLHLLSLTETGVEEIISDRNKLYKDLRRNKLLTDTMSLNEWLEFMLRNPLLLRIPIIMDEKKLQVGFNADEIRKFIPRMIRKKNVPLRDAK
jgi:regulatory protein spx